MRELASNLREELRTFAARRKRIQLALSKSFAEATQLKMSQENSLRREETNGAHIARNEDSIASGNFSRVRGEVFKKTVALVEEMDEFSNREEDLILRTQSKYVNEINPLVILIPH